MTISTPTEIGRTTLWGGSGLALTGLIALLAWLRFVVPLTTSRSLPLASEIPLAAAAVVMLASTVVLAFGVRGESGIVGPSRLGKLALLLFGASDLLSTVFGLVPSSQIPGVPANVLAGEVADVLVVVFVIFAAVAVVRAKVLHGAARWMLVVVAVVETITMFTPGIVMSLAPGQLGLLHLFLVLQPLTLLALGLTYALHGRSASIRRRMQVINGHR